MIEESINVFFKDFMAVYGKFIKLNSIKFNYVTGLDGTTYITISINITIEKEENTIQIFIQE